MPPTRKISSSLVCMLSVGAVKTKFTLSFPKFHLGIASAKSVYKRQLFSKVIREWMMVCRCWWGRHKSQGIKILWGMGMCKMRKEILLIISARNFIFEFLVKFFLFFAIVNHKYTEYYRWESELCWIWPMSHHI